MPLKIPYQGGFALSWQMLVLMLTPLNLTVPGKQLHQKQKLSVPIKEILDTAGWSSERTFDRFYNKPFQGNGGFATSVLNID